LFGVYDLKVRKLVDRCDGDVGDDGGYYEEEEST
jgi:hypothetical protein